MNYKAWSLFFGVLTAWWILLSVAGFVQGHLIVGLLDALGALVMITFFKNAHSNYKAGL